MAAILTRRPWTDDELGYIADSKHLTAAEVADHLGRTKASVDAIRKRMREGMKRQNPPWTPDEEEKIVDMADGFTLEQIAQRVPGRTSVAIARRLYLLGIRRSTHSHAYDPSIIGRRPLLAKTCPRCGVLRGSECFHVKPSGNRQSYCIFCQATHAKKRRTDPASPRDNGAAAIRARVWSRAAKLITEPADRAGQPYLESDFETLSDPALSVLCKALRLGRTYSATKNACHKLGYTSRGGDLSKREYDQWLIENPNADRVAEITAALKQEFADANVPFPQWDWDD